eukprot:Gb_41110 [translate_table: standard]
MTTVDSGWNVVFKSISMQPQLF